MFYLLLSDAIGQFNLETSPFRTNSLCIKPDSLFEYYEYANFDSLHLHEYSTCEGNYFSGIYFACNFETDTTNRISKIQILPLKGWGNSIPDTSSLWNIMTELILSASKKWILKPYLYKPTGYETDQGLRK
jgi:hypothetical protein